MKATIKQIKNVQNLNLVAFELEEFELIMVSLELQNGLKIGSKVLLSVKASSVIIATESHTKLSFDNSIKMQIKSIEIGEILTSLELHTPSIKLESIITSQSAKKLKLANEMSVYALINASDISIVELLS